ncbi:ADP-ribosylglycohydrolase family protein [Kitasatospora acidiphila]|uniref:ADP-ribosylglycohydrolase family protein n=1 Tax=Kitasatospora acidiphila TaxID=2567942 RepID=UPI001C66E401|nr:ADP-ribosylglycohydrolase family protein [Kitasatospora acidiphila]
MSDHFSSSTDSTTSWSSFNHRAAARDSLYGVAVGDAYGAQHFVPETLAVLRAGDLPAAPWPWTDDAEMACSVFAALRLRGTVDQRELDHSFAEHHDFDRGYGAAMNQLLRESRESGWQQERAAKLFDGQGSWGNGAAMRVAPLGAWFAVDPAEAAWQAARSAEVTHTHPEAVAGTVAVAVAAAVAAGSRGRLPAPEELLRPVIELTPAGRIRDAICEALELTAQPHEELAEHKLGNGRNVSAFDTVPFTLWCAARHLDDFAAGLRATASAGGDVDTTCAIVGGILAARLGVAGIPGEWLAAVEQLPDWVEPENLGADAGPGDVTPVRPILNPKPLAVPDLAWTPGQWQRVRHGVQPSGMEEKWQAVLDGNRLLIFRSWTGNCIFTVDIEPVGSGARPVAAWVESARDRYRGGTAEAEAVFLEVLLEQFFGHRNRRDLWDRYQRLRYGS